MINNTKGNVGAYAGIFIVLFLFGGFMGMITLPEFTGRFFLCGLAVGVLGTGGGSIIVHLFGR